MLNYTLMHNVNLLLYERKNTFFWRILATLVDHLKDIFGSDVVSTVDASLQVFYQHLQKLVVES
ncbi:unnamed protein product [Brassica rapa subsp. narinosa]